MIRFVLGNALFQELDLVKPAMLLKMGCLAIDKLCSLVYVLRAIISLWHWSQRLGARSKELGSININIQASVVTWKADAKRLIATCLNSICQFRVQKHVVNTGGSSGIRIEGSCMMSVLVKNNVLKAAVAA